LFCDKENRGKPGGARGELTSHRKKKEGRSEEEEEKGSPKGGKTILIFVRDKIKRALRRKKKERDRGGLEAFQKESRKKGVA